MDYDLKKILYVTDLSENAEYAFGYAFSMAKRFSAKITALHVIEEPSQGTNPPAGPGSGEKQRAVPLETQKTDDLAAIRQRIVDSCASVCEEARSGGIMEQVIVTAGNAEDEILSMVDEQEFDLVVLGVHAVTAVGKALLDYTARRVVRQCTKPVLVVHLPNT